jgi:hypothetical protein
MESGINALIETLSSRISDAEEAVKSLQEKLAAILKPAPPSNDGEGDAQTDSSELAGSIYVECQRLVHVCSSIKEIQERLDF